MLFDMIVTWGCFMQGYMTVKDASAKWGLSSRWVNKLCQDERIPGVTMFAGAYAIPADAEKPTLDRRVKTGAYKDWRKKYGKNKITN
jgi:hypothetical protein